MGLLFKHVSINLYFHYTKIIGRCVVEASTSSHRPLSLPKLLGCTFVEVFPRVFVRLLMNEVNSFVCGVSACH